MQKVFCTVSVRKDMQGAISDVCSRAFSLSGHRVGKRTCLSGRGEKAYGFVLIPLVDGKFGGCVRGVSHVRDGAWSRNGLRDVDVKIESREARMGMFE